MPRYAALVMEMQVGLAKGQTAGSPTGSWPALLSLYDRLPELDFSRDLLEGRAADLCVMRVPPCGWSDLGTPRRVAATLSQLSDQAWPKPDADVDVDVDVARLNLAAQQKLLAGDRRSQQRGIARGLRPERRARRDSSAASAPHGGC